MISGKDDGGSGRWEKLRFRREAMIRLCDLTHRADESKATPVADPLRGRRSSVELALQKHGLELWYDEMARRHMVSAMTGHAWPLDDARMRVLDALLDEECGMKFPWTRLKMYLLTLADEKKRHPVREYLDGLTWDGVHRVDAWLSTYLGADATPYTREVGRCVLTGAVARVRQPGCKFDEMMILEGDDSYEMASLASALTGNPDWHTYSAALAGSVGGFVKSVAGKWIAVDMNLRQLTKSDAWKLHTRLSSSQDRIRNGRYLVDLPRQCILIGTTRKKKYLKKANRRFWPVEVRQIRFDAVERDRDQLWAEAALLQVAGEATWRMHESVWKLAAIEQEKRTLLK